MRPSPAPSWANFPSRCHPMPSTTVSLIPSDTIPLDFRTLSLPHRAHARSRHPWVSIFIRNDRDEKPNTVSNHSTRKRTQARVSQKPPQREEAKQAAATQSCSSANVARPALNCTNFDWTATRCIGLRRRCSCSAASTHRYREEAPLASQITSRFARRVIPTVISGRLNFSVDWRGRTYRDLRP